MTNSNKKYISEVLGQDYLNWEAGDIVEISSGTDTGKTYFIKNILLNYAKENGDRILYLCNRKNLRNQVKFDILSKKRNDITISDVVEVSDTIGNITVTTYQALENYLYNRDFGDTTKEIPEARVTKFNLNRYKYIVCDEAHFLLEDSSFNSKVELSYQELINKFHSKSIKLYISGTIEDLRTSIEESKYSVMHKYTLEKDYNIYNIKCFNKLETLEDEIYKSKDDNNKWLVFSNTIEKGKRLKEDLNALDINSVFIDRTTKEEDNELSSIITKATFNSKVFITTKVLDNGVNFEDDDLNNIVIMSHEKNTFLQMLGRVRNPKNKRINLYIYNYSNRGLLNTYSHSYLEPLKALNTYRESYQLFEQEYLWRLDEIPNKLFYIHKTENAVAENLTVALKESGVKKFELEKDRLNNLLEGTKEDRYYFTKVAIGWLNRDNDFNAVCLLDEVIDDEISNRLEEELSFAFESRTPYTKEIFLENYNRIIESDKNLYKRFIKLSGNSKDKAKGQKAFNKLFEDLYTNGLLNELYVVSTQVKYKTMKGKKKKITYWIITKVES